MKKQSEASQLKYGSSFSKYNTKHGGDEKENSTGPKTLRDAPGVRRDFFGRIVNKAAPATGKDKTEKRKSDRHKTERKVWVTFHEGFSNAVRKPISMNELLADL
jgi:chromosome transmission fidelity protein 18